MQNGYEQEHWSKAYMGLYTQLFYFFSFNKCLPSTYYEIGTLRGARKSVMKETDEFLVLRIFTISWGKEISMKI